MESTPTVSPPTNPTSPTGPADLEAVRSRRVRLRKALGQLEGALAAPADRSGDWGARVHAALTTVAEEVEGHIAVTEGPDGLHQTVLTQAVRLANAVAALVAEHERISAEIATLRSDTAGPLDADGIESVRERGTALLVALARHRQRGADLIYEAYDTDIGGGD